MRTIIGLILLALASPAFAVESINAFDYSLLEAERSRCERCMNRCRRNACANEPTPTPRPTATPTPVPLPCEMFDTRVVKDYDEGQQRMLCFDVRGNGPAIVEVMSQNTGNTSCAQMQTTLISPSGQTADSLGVQPGGAMLREQGRWYFWTKLLWGNPGSCRTYVFTVTK